MAWDTGDVGDVIDRLTQADVAGRGVIGPLREAAVATAGPGAAMRAAERLDAAVGPGDTVIVLTGFLIPPTMAPETDGPPGAVSIARAIDAELAADPIIVCEAEAVEVCVATARAGGLTVQDRADNHKTDGAVAVEAFPADENAAAEYVAELLETDPSAVLAVEKVGPNPVGRYHTMAGDDVTERAAKVDRLFDALEDHSGKVTTIGVGDGGNEVGMGAIEAAVRESVPYGETCRCGCGAGIAAATATDILVPAAISNWGAHGIVAALSALTGRQLLHEAADEGRLLEAASEAGAVDGIRGERTGSCDGLPVEVHESVVRLLRAIPTPGGQN